MLELSNPSPLHLCVVLVENEFNMLGRQERFVMYVGFNTFYHFNLIPLLTVRGKVIVITKTYKNDPN